MLKRFALALLASLLSLQATADLLTFQGQYAIQLEEDAAVANQAIYDQLLAIGCPDTSLDVTSTACSSSFTFMVWEKVRELVHTANDLCDPLDGCGASEFSLQIDLEGLGNVLRWHSAEEFSSQEEMADSFLGGQLTNLQARVSAIRGGASGFNIAGMPAETNGEWITLYNAHQAGLNAGDETPQWSPWGGFLNIAYNWGDQDATEREAAYDFDGRGMNGGFDYRINNTWIVGTTFAAQLDRIDFDSEKSIVDGKVNMDAYSLIPFLLFQETHWFMLASIGYQHATFENERGIRYNSNNINIADVNTKTVSENKAEIYTGSVSTGYTWNIPSYTAFSIEPSVTINYQKTIVEEFSEKDIKNDGFNLFIKEQQFDALESIMALRFQHVFSSSAGVFVPFIEAAHHTQHETDPHVIEATYVDATRDFGTDTLFRVEADPVERGFNVYTAGISFVLRGASQQTLGGPARGGLQGFISGSTVENISAFSQYTLAGGLRYEF